MILDKIKEILTKKNNIYICDSQSPYFLDSFKESLVKGLVDGNKDCVSSFDNSTSLSEILDFANAPDFFVNYKIIFASFFSQQFSTDDLERLTIISNSTKLDYTLVFIDSPAFNKTKIKLKRISINDIKLTPLDIQMELIDFCRRHGVTLNEMQAIKLLQMSNNSLDYAISEVKKLIEYSRDRGCIQDSDIDIIVNSNIDKATYELTNALLDKNYKKACIEANALIKRGISPAIITSMLYNNYRRIMFCSLSDMSKNDIMSIFQQKEYPAQKIMQYSKKYSQVTLKRIVEYIAKCEYEFKSGKYSENTALDNILFNICNVNKKEVIWNSY